MPKTHPLARTPPLPNPPPPEPSATADVFDDSVLLHALHRLDVRDLVRARSVCKRWQQVGGQHPAFVAPAALPHISTAPTYEAQTKSALAGARLRHQLLPPPRACRDEAARARLQAARTGTQLLQRAVAYLEVRRLDEAIVLLQGVEAGTPGLGTAWLSALVHRPRPWRYVMRLALNLAEEGRNAVTAVELGRVQAAYDDWEGRTYARSSVVEADDDTAMLWRCDTQALMQEADALLQRALTNLESARSLGRTAEQRAYAALDISVDARDANGLSELHHAIVAMDASWVEALIAEGANPNLSHPRGSPAASMFDHIDKPNWNACDPDNDRVVRSHQVFRVLCRSGAEFGNDVLHRLIFLGQPPDLVPALVAHDPSCIEDESEGRTPLESAFEQDDLDWIEATLQAGAKADDAALHAWTESGEWWNASEEAAGHSERVVRLLLQRAPGCLEYARPDDWPPCVWRSGQGPNR